MTKRHASDQAHLLGFKKGKHTGRLSAQKVQPPTFEPCTFAVFDVEATGVGPKDRVVEIAIVRMTSDGSHYDEWSTLVNPGRDLGAARIHGLIDFEDVRKAPRFGDVLGDVCQRLMGTVVVAHNLAFDLRMLSSEMARRDVALPTLPTLCTLRLGASLGVKQRRLIDVCRQFGIPLQNLHCALDDARAAAHLLGRYVALHLANGLSTLQDLGCTVPVPPPMAWPEVSSSGQVASRTTLGAPEEPPADVAFLSRVLSRVEDDSRSPEGMEYFALLDRVLEDFQVTRDEADDLRSFAEEAGFDSDEIAHLHREYVREILAAAWADDVLTSEEQDVVAKVATLLSVPSDELQRMSAEASRRE